MLKKAMYFLFALSFLSVSNGYADEEVTANDDVEVTVSESTEVTTSDVDSKVVENTESSEQDNK